MMNDALMQMKSRHNNKTTYLTGIARRALLLFTLLLCVGGSVWGQVMNVSTGIVDSQNYGWFKSSFPNNITSAYINEIYDGSWSGLSLNQSEHWNGNTGTQYADSWSKSPLSGYRTTTVNLPKGKYILLAAGRGSAGVTLSMKIAGKEVTMAGRGNTGKGVTKSGEASFDSGEFANDGNGFGWEYFFISFEVGDGGANGVEISVGGTSTEGNKWMSFTTPQLWKAPDDVSSTDLTAAMFHNWSSPNAGATDNGAVSGAACVLNTATGLPYGDGNVYYLNYADLSNYKTLQLTVTEGTPRLLFNRQTNGGQDFLEINSTSSTYVRALNSLWIIDLEKIRENNGGYVHLNCIKGANNANVTIKSMKLTAYPAELTSELYKRWDGVGKSAHESGTPGMENHIGSEVASGGTIYGDGNVDLYNYADLSSYNKMIISYSGNTPRLLFNRQDANTYTEINSAGDYATIEDGLMTIDLTKLAVGGDKFAHLNVIKAWGGATTINSIHLYTEQEYADINTFTLGNESNCETHVLYQLDPNSGNFTVDLAKFKDKILGYFGKTGNSFNGFGTLYLRWYVIDNATSKYLPNQDEILNAVGNSGGDHHKEDVGMLWFDDGYRGENPRTPITDGNCADVLNADVSLPSGKTATNVTLVCVLTDDLSDLYIKHEPQNLKHKILIRFISNWDAESNSDFILSNSTPSQTFSTQVNMEQGATETVEGQLQTALVGLYNQASASSSSLNGAIPQYVRVYLTNSNGVMINATNGYWTSLFSNADSYQNKRDKGYVWAKTEWSSFNINNIVNTVLTKPDGYDWSNVRVVCDLTDDLTGSYFVGTGLMEEPTNLKARLIVSFKEKSSDAYSATSSELTTGMTITRKHYSTVTANLDLATSEHFTDVNAKFDGHLNDNSNLERLYIRWYIADKDGEWIPTPEGITLSPVFAGYADKVIGENNYGKVLYIGNAGATVTANMLKMNVQVANANVDLNDYLVVCAMTYADEGYTTEPALKAKYVYSFVSPYEGKLSDNAITHTKEVIVTAADQGNGSVVIPIDSYYDEIASDFGVNAYDVGRNLHIRWYVEYNGERYFNSEQLLEPVNNGIGYKVHYGSGDTEGSLYWNTSIANLNYNPQGNFNIKFTPLSSDLIWENYKIIAVLTNDISAVNGQEVSNGELVREPQLLNLQYTFSLIDGVFKFVHHKGASGRDYITVSGSAPERQYSWDNDNNRVVGVTSNKNIRQGVHTVNYDVFINPNDGPKLLKLPFEAYEGTNGNNLEPMAYIRWYDWASDLYSSHLNKVGTWLNALSDVSGNRGLFMLNNSVSGLKPTQARVGVTYDASGLQTSGDIIACDVSKYYDGLYPGTEDDTRADFSGRMYPQFIHEPTLSTRYLFHVYPSSVIAAELKAGHDKFDEAFYKLQDGTWTYDKDSKAYMFSDIYEDNGRVVVSLNGSTGTFALRADLYSINNYYINNGYSQCDHVTWRAYLEDEGGLWRKTVQVIPSTNKRIELFDLSNLSGDYEYLGTSRTTKGVTAAPGMRFHVVGFVGAGGEENAAVHYELQFLDAPAILADNLAATDMKRTSAYLEQHFRKGGEVTFDNFFADKSEPTSESNNMLFSPLPWEEAEYGFCYPTIDKYRIRTGWSGITPIHGDYMLVKSVKKANVSAQCDDSGDVPATGCEYAYHWYTWNPAIMYDYTHQLNSSEYGGYIYVDASDESRTIATLDFDASLCSGSQIYFTAAIADLTSAGATSPQLMAHVYANGSNGEKIQVLSFLTSVLNTVNAGDGGDYKYNKWYQVYGHGSVPENIDISNYTSFSVVIDNYSKDTNGADFCVDQIVFYTSTGKMHVEQTGAQCEDQNMKVTAYMNVEHLEAMMTLGETAKPIYYRLFKKTSGSTGAVQYETLTDPSLYGNGSNSYGQVSIYKYVLDANGMLDTNETTKNAGYEYRNGILYFNLFKDKEFNLPQGEEYFIGLTENLESPNLSMWANPNDACDVYSNFFVPRKTFISFLDSQSHSASTTIISNCENDAANNLNYTVKAVVPDENDPSGFKTISGVKYDFFIGTVDELKSGGAYAGLVGALKDYRDCELNWWHCDYSSAPNHDYYDLGTMQAGYYDIINSAYNDGKLIMSASENLQKTVLETTDFVAIPVKEVYRVGDTDYHLCDYFAFTITVDGYPGIPNLTLGFDDVDYSTAGTERVLRVGLEQLNKMRKTTDGYKLHIPVNMYKDKKRHTTKKLYFPSDSYLTISATNDNTQSIGRKFAKIVPINSTDTRPYVDKNHMYLSLDLSGDNCTIDFHEGYQYEVSVSYHDEDDENVTNPCIGDLFILIKVVPEFVTWESQPVDNDGNTTSSSEYYSANWYNDDNWKRSTRDELYKGVAGGSQNTATTAHPNGYENNGEGSLSSLSGNSGFVPMKFTYVTMPSNNHAPSLINEPRVVGEGVGSRRQGGGFLKLGDGDDETWLKTDRSPRDPDGTPKESRTSSLPTENIYYDMLVRYSYSPTDQFGEGCFGHRYLNDNGIWADQGTEDLTAKVFDCEKFQGNICREIYFKPGAELLRQQRLTYEKAWVEMELDANKWYLLASPLQSTYAGDMYVPTSMTDVSLPTPADVKGRQVTEAFQPINFDQSKGYSRTLYPIYQRSWGLNNGTVYVKDNDIRANSYSANLKFNSVSTSLVEWGHTFNDVQVPYHTSAQTLDNNLAGFSIRAHKKDQTDKTLIRLPKADKSYEYFDWTNTSSDPAADGVKAVSKVDYEYIVDGETKPLFTVPYSYRLVTDEHQRDGDLEYSIIAMQQNGDYVLVGNPYMVSIDMKKFFDTNSTLDQTGYWTYEASAAVAHTKPTTVCSDIIKPMQGFFVKKGTATKIVFNRDMQIDGNFPPSAPSTGNGARQTTVTLSAANSRGSSSASLEVSEKASAGYVGGEDVETLFDSNLADVPMVYTVSADGQAVSINQLPALEVVPFGVSCSGDEMIDVTVDHSVYVFDALLGTTTAVKEGKSVSIQPNDYGRYYLTVSEDASGLLTNKAVAGITISVRDRVVTVTSNDDINQVKAVNVSGATAYESTVGSKTTQFTLPTGTYIIDVNGVAGNKTVKILVK